MKLTYTRWKDVRKFLASIDLPVSTEFQIIIRSTWEKFNPSTLNKAGGRWVYHVEIPKEYIT